jgi:hypothetical protein
MKALNLHRRCLRGLMCVIPLAFAFEAAAGEKIIVSEGKSQTDPTKDVKSDLFKSSPTKFDQPMFDYNSLGIVVLPRSTPLTKKDQERLKARREAKADWLMGSQEELERREEAESTLGVANNPLDDINKGSRSSRWLEPKSNPGQRLPGQLLSPGQISKQEQADAKQAQEQRNRQDAEDENSHRTKTFDLIGSSDGQAGAHTASELNLKALFDPAQKDSLSSAGTVKPDFSLRTLMGTPQLRTKDQQTRMDDFNKFLNSPGSAQSSLAPGSPLNFSGSAGSATPAFAPKPPESSPTRPAGGDFFRQNPSSFGSTPNRFDPPGLPSLNNNNSTLGNGSPFQRQMPAAQDSSRNWMKPIEPQRRKF